MNDSPKFRPVSEASCEVQLENFSDLGPLRLINAARGLSLAVKVEEMAVGQLKVELPYVAQGYSGTIRAAKRIASVRERAPQANLFLPSVVWCGKLAVGVATLQVADPYPSLMPDGRFVEMSYWHVPEFSDRESILIGCNVVAACLERVQEIPGIESGLHELWSVTLPEDEIKKRVMISSGFQRVGNPDTYQLGDGVEPDVERQLWAHTTITR